MISFNFSTSSDEVGSGNGIATTAVSPRKSRREVDLEAIVLAVKQRYDAAIQAVVEEQLQSAVTILNDILDLPLQTGKSTADSASQSDSAAGESDAQISNHAQPIAELRDGPVITFSNASQRYARLPLSFLQLQLTVYRLLGDVHLELKDSVAAMKVYLIACQLHHTIIQRQLAQLTANAKQVPLRMKPIAAQLHSQLQVDTHLWYLLARTALQLGQTVIARSTAEYAMQYARDGESLLLLELLLDVYIVAADQQAAKKLAAYLQTLDLDNHKAAAIMQKNTQPFRQLHTQHLQRTAEAMENASEQDDVQFVRREATYQHVTLLSRDQPVTYNTYAEALTELLQQATTAPKAQPTQAVPEQGPAAPRAEVAPLYLTTPVELLTIRSESSTVIDPVPDSDSQPTIHSQSLSEPFTTPPSTASQRADTLAHSQPDTAAVGNSATRHNAATRRAAVIAFVRAGLPADLSEQIDPVTFALRSEVSSQSSTFDSQRSASSLVDGQNRSSSQQVSLSASDAQAVYELLRNAGQAGIVNASRIYCHHVITKRWTVTAAAYAALDVQLQAIEQSTASSTDERSSEHNMGAHLFAAECILHAYGDEMTIKQRKALTHHLAEFDTLTAIPSLSSQQLPPSTVTQYQIRRLLVQARALAVSQRYSEAEALLHQGLQLVKANEECCSRAAMLYAADMSVITAASVQRRIYDLSSGLAIDKATKLESQRKFEEVIQKLQPLLDDINTTCSKSQRQAMLKLLGFAAAATPGYQSLTLRCATLQLHMLVRQVASSKATAVLQSNKQLRTDISSALQSIMALLSASAPTCEHEPPIQLSDDDRLHLQNVIAQLLFLCMQSPSLVNSVATYITAYVRISSYSPQPNACDCHTTQSVLTLCETAHTVSEQYEMCSLPAGRRVQRALLDELFAGASIRSTCNQHNSTKVAQQLRQRAIDAICQNFSCALHVFNLSHPAHHEESADESEYEGMDELTARRMLAVVEALLHRFASEQKRVSSSAMDEMLQALDAIGWSLGLNKAKMIREREELTDDEDTPQLIYSAPSYVQKLLQASDPVQGSMHLLPASTAAANDQWPTSFYRTYSALLSDSILRDLNEFNGDTFCMKQSDADALLPYVEYCAWAVKKQLTTNSRDVYAWYALGLLYWQYSQQKAHTHLTELCLDSSTLSREEEDMLISILPQWRFAQRCFEVALCLLIPSDPPVTPIGSRYPPLFSRSRIELEIRHKLAFLHYNNAKLAQRVLVLQEGFTLAGGIQWRLTISHELQQAHTHFSVMQQLVPWNWLYAYMQIQCQSATHAELMQRYEPVAEIASVNNSVLYAKRTASVLASFDGFGGSKRRRTVDGTTAAAASPTAEVITVERNHISMLPVHHLAAEELAVLNSVDNQQLDSATVNTIISTLRGCVETDAACYPSLLQLAVLSLTDRYNTVIDDGPALRSWLLERLEAFVIFDRKKPIRLFPILPGRSDDESASDIGVVDTAGEGPAWTLWWQRPAWDPADAYMQCLTAYLELCVAERAAGPIRTSFNNLLPKDNEIHTGIDQRRVRLYGQYLHKFVTQELQSPGPSTISPSDVDTFMARLLTVAIKCAEDSQPLPNIALLAHKLYNKIMSPQQARNSTELPTSTSQALLEMPSLERVDEHGAAVSVNEPAGRTGNPGAGQATAAEWAEVTSWLSNQRWSRRMRYQQLVPSADDPSDAPAD